ncbi:MAG: hypothetical protein AAB378_00870 [Patescibacteria group bacterium]
MNTYYKIFEGLQDIAQGIAAILGRLIAFALGFKILIILMIATASMSFLLIMHYLRVKTKTGH